MARWKRIALGLLVAYAASMTLYASRKSAEAYLFRRILYDHGAQRTAFQKSESFPLLMVAKDYGVDLTLLDIWSLRLADIQGLLMVPLVVLFFLLGLCAAWIPSPSRSNFDKD